MSDCSKQMNLHNVISAHRLARVHEANVQVRCALVVEAADRDGHRLDVQPVATEPRVLCRPPIALAAIAQVAVGVGEDIAGEEDAGDEAEVEASCTRNEGRSALTVPPVVVRRLRPVEAAYTASRLVISTTVAAFGTPVRALSTVLNAAVTLIS